MPRRAYLEGTRSASAALLFVLPLLVLYEGALAALGGDPALRTGADAWVAGAIAGRWPVPEASPSLALAVVLLGWTLVERRGPVPPRWLAGMAVESLALGAGLLGVFVLCDRGLDRFERHLLLAGGAVVTGLDPERAVGLIGAGIFEEALFRLLMLPAAFGILRGLRVPAAMATTLAVTGTALGFSMAHHVGGAPGEYDWFVFVFRWLAGVWFAWAFILRGFGVAVGTHVAYDLLVGALLVPG